MIDDQYWLRFAKDQISIAIKSRDEAALKLDNFLSVTWSIYTATFTVGMILGSITQSLCLKAFFCFPVFIIPLVKLICIETQLPKSVSFYSNIPESIEHSCYISILRHKNRMLNLAKIGAVISVFSISIALFLFKINR